MCMLRYKWYRGSIPSPVNESIPGCGHTEGWRIERCEEARARCRGEFCERPQPILRLEDSYTMGNCRECMGLRPFVPYAPPFENPEQVDDPAYQNKEEQRRAAEDQRRLEQEQQTQEEVEELPQYDPHSPEGQAIHQQNIARYEEERLQQRREAHRRYQEQNAEYAMLQMREAALVKRRTELEATDRSRRIRQMEAETERLRAERLAKKDEEERGR
ncbi:uncharacterized protein N7511_011154 [Penicillium nucicola]|uniref:uncharacterized protein n=1 Tax=Penicillium nucicola TaxID=1850975 RepID=UPI0025458A7D|nr:uncharacterized protein N7511_011154 [Penicillium nucicola]KAJ5742753.1 hypothetical protein N7511_011154 [Penicillium nucicola]